MSAWIPRTATPKSPCVPRKLPLNSANRPHRTPLRTPKRRHGETTRRFSLGCPRFEAELCAVTHAVPPLPMQSRHWCATYSGAAHNCRHVARNMSAVFDLVDGIRTPQVDCRALFGGELRSQNKRPMVQLVANHFGTQVIGCRLKGFRIGRGQEGIIVLAETDVLTPQFALNEVVAVNVVSGLKRKKRADAHHHWAEDFIADIEIQMREARGSFANQTIVRIIGGVLGHQRPETVAPLHALQDEIHAITVLPLHALEVGPNVIFFSDALLGPLHRNPLFARESFNPSFVFVSSLRQRFFCDRVNFLYIPKELDHVFLSDHESQISLYDYAI